MEMTEQEFNEKVGCLYGELQAVQKYTSEQLYDTIIARGVLSLIKDTANFIGQIKYDNRDCKEK